MKLSFKNKMLMGLLAMCDEGVKKGGIPKHIHLSVGEGVELLKELHYLANEGETAANSVLIKPQIPLEDLEDQFHPARLAPMIKSVDAPLTDQTLHLAVGFWSKGDLIVTYHHDMLVIPLIVDKSTNSAGSGWGTGVNC